MCTSLAGGLSLNIFGQPEAEAKEEKEEDDVKVEGRGVQCGNNWGLPSNPMFFFFFFGGGAVFIVFILH